MAQIEENPRKYFLPIVGTSSLDYSGTFTASSSSFIRVIKNSVELVDPDDYSVNVSTGIVTLVANSVADDEYGVYRKTNIERSTTFINTGTVTLETLDSDLDKFIRILQELNDKADNLCIRYDESTDQSSTDRVIPAAVTNGVLQFDEDGNLVAIVPS